MRVQAAYLEATKKFQRQFIKEALEKNNHNVTQTALEIGLDPIYLHKKIRVLGLRISK